MSNAVVYTVRDGVAFVAVSNPPNNALSHQVRAGLMAAIAAADTNPAVQEIVLQGRGASFCTGPDIAELTATAKSPSLSQLCNRIEACRKPVVAALHGMAVGGGFELALAAHYRVAHVALRIGLPEVRLGLMPSAGATQRAPRLAGAGVSLDLMLSGRLLPVNGTPAQIFFDTLTKGDVSQAAIAFCKDLRMAGQGPRPTRDIRAGFNDPADYQAETAKRRGALTKHPEQAHKEIVAAVEAAMLLPFEAGLALEEAAFEQLLASDQSAALRHAVLAERRVAATPLPEGAQLPEIKTVCVLGGGALAVQITAACLQSGLAVRWGTRDPAPLKHGMDQVRALFQKGVARGAVTQEKVDQLLAGLAHGDSAAMTYGADVILHAARGQGDVPAPPQTVRVVAMPGRVDEVGMRFAMPVFSARLVEVISGPMAEPGQIVVCRALARAMNKVAVPVQSSGGSIAARMVSALQRAADALVDAGQHPYAIDAAVRNWGWTRPPFEMRDVIGLADLADDPRADGAVNWSRVLLDQGRGGRAKGDGFYAYTAQNSAPVADPQAMQVIDQKRATGRPMAAGHIVRLLIGALANEGLRIVEDGWVTRASDIDVVMLLGQDFPRWRGGPMQAADALGLFTLRQTMTRFDHPDADFWTPRPLFGDLIKNGLSLGSYVHPS